METWRFELYHSSGPWKEHKYIKKVGDRYYYAEEAKNVLGDVKMFGKTQSERVADASQSFRNAQLEKYEKEDSYYKKAPEGILAKIDWALGRIGEGLPIDNKEYTVYFRSGKRVVEAVKNEPVTKRGKYAKSN